MSKNILVLSSSPRSGGNSDLLCDQFVAGSERRPGTMWRKYL